MSIGTPNGILDITGATLRVSKMEFRQSTGFDTVLNNVARNTMLLMDETEQTTSNSWALKLPNAWVAEFHGYWASGSSGAPILFNFYNDSTSGTNGYTLSMNDTTISINYDGGSTLGSATLSSTLNNDAYRKVAIIFERSVLDVSVDGEHVFHFADSQLRDRVYDNNSGYVTFTHSSTDERKLKNLKFTNGDKWVREIDSSNIAYVGGNVGIGTTIPGTKLDVSGTVRGTHLMGDGSAISAIQSSNVSDFGSNVTRIGTLETDLGDNSSRITNLSSNLSDNSSRITALESGDISISGDKTFTGDIIFESNIHMNGGNVFVANTVNMTVSDPIIELGLNNIGTNDLGIIMTRPAANSNVAFVYDESDDILRMGYTLNGANDSIVELDSNALAVSVQGALSAASVSGDGSGLTSLNASNITTGALSTTSVTIDDYLIHDGDTDTKVGFPLADTFAVNTAGSERLRVDSSGLVGIGTTSPAATLDIRGAVADPSTPTVHIGDNSADAGDYGMVNLVRDGTNGGSKSHLAFIRSGHSALGMGFHNNTNTWGIFPSFSSVTNTPAMAITSDGKVGIGTTNPSTKLHVEHYGSAIGDFEGLRIANHATNLHSTSRPAYEFVVSDINNGTGIGNSKFAIGYRGTTSASRTDRLVIDNVGNVGIGTTNPSQILHLLGQGTGSGPKIRFETLNNGNGDYTVDGTEIGGIQFAADDLTWTTQHTSSEIVGIHRNPNYSGAQGDLVFKTSSSQGSNPTEKMRINHDGNVGIGTASPRQKLEVANGHIAIVTNTYKSGADDDQLAGKIDFHLGGTSGELATPVAAIEAYDKWMGGSYFGALAFKVMGTQRMRIDPSGNVGIGTTNPSYNLDVVGGLSVTYADSNAMKIDGGGTLRRHWIHNSLDYGAGFHFTSEAIWPTNYAGTYVNNSIDLGHTSYRWKNVYTERIVANQPRFFAYSNNGSTSFSGGATFVLNATAYNSGSHYSTSTGYFTAPINGVYHFTVGLYTYTATQFSWKLVPTAGSLSSNNAHVSRNNGTGDDLLLVEAFNSGQHGGSITLYLNANEQFGFGSRSSSGSYYRAHSHFSGYLLSQV